MRDSIENVSQLQKQLNALQLENQMLKNILDRAGLSYHKELSALFMKRYYGVLMNIDDIYQKQKTIV